MAVIRYRWTGSRYVASFAIATAIAVVGSFPGGGTGGVVVSVHDGDTMRIRTSSGDVTVRLYGVDAPELKQPYGAEAGAFVGALCVGQSVRLVEHDRDRYGRIVAEVGLADGRDVGNELLVAGLAWWYARYAPRDEVKRGLEERARAAGVGLWSGPSPVAPWDWRGRYRSKKETRDPWWSEESRVVLAAL